MRSYYDRLSIQDLNHLWVEVPDTPMQIIAVLQLEPGPRVDDDGQLRLEDGLGSRDGCGRSPAHVLGGSVPAPGTEAELLEVVASLFMQLDRSHALWEVWLLTGLASGRVALVLKLHHVIADGLAATPLGSDR